MKSSWKKKFCDDAKSELTSVMDSTDFNQKISETLDNIDHLRKLLLKNRIPFGEDSCKSATSSFSPFGYPESLQIYDQEGVNSDCTYNDTRSNEDYAQAVCSLDDDDDDVISVDSLEWDNSLDLPYDPTDQTFVDSLEEVLASYYSSPNSLDSLNNSLDDLSTINSIETDTKTFQFHNDCDSLYSFSIPDSEDTLCADNWSEEVSMRNDDDDDDEIVTSSFTFDNTEKIVEIDPTNDEVESIKDKSCDNGDNYYASYDDRCFPKNSSVLTKYRYLSATKRVKDLDEKSMVAAELRNERGQNYCSKKKCVVSLKINLSNCYNNNGFEENNSDYSSCYSSSTSYTTFYDQLDRLFVST